MTKIKKVIAYGTAAGMALLTNPMGVLATTIDLEAGATGRGNISTIRINNIVTSLIQILLGIAGVVSFIMLLWGGLQWILSGGDKEGTEKARKRITAALIGLAVVFSAYALIFIVGQLFGITVLDFTLNPIGTGA